MSEIVAMHQADDPTDIIHRAVERLAQGDLVVLPTETRYVVAVNGLRTESVVRLKSLVERQELGRGVLAVSSNARALDFVPQPGPLAEKLLRRCWPGPIAFELPVLESVRGMISALPAETRNLAQPNGSVILRSPAHEAIQGILRLLAGPLVMVGEYSARQPAGGHLPEWIQDEAEHLGLIVDDGDCRYRTSATLVRVSGTTWELLHEGVIAERTIKHLASHFILFVCTGNTCRSPMAEALFRKLLTQELNCTDEELGEKGFIVASAGLSAMLGGRPAAQAVEALRSREIDLTGHESQPVTARLISQADRVYAMTRGHRDAILQECPDAVGRVELLSRRGMDISDPYGSHLEIYEQCAAEMEQHLRIILKDMLSA